MNLTDLLSEQASKQPLAPAIIQPGNTLDYRQFDLLVWQAAALLRQRGILPGNTVALSIANELGIVVCMLALARLGATVLSLPTTWPAALRSATIAGAGATVVLCDSSGAAIAGLKRVVFSLADAAAISGTIDASVRTAHPDAPWLIVSGSGTTGRSKMMPISHAQQRARCDTAKEWLGLTSADRVGSLMHFNYSSTKTRFLEGLAQGAAFYIPDRRRDDIPAHCKTAGVSVLHTTVFHLEQLMAAPRRAAGPLLNFLRVLTVGSSTVTDEFRKRVAANLSGNLHIHYGTNETGLLTFATPPLLFELPGTVGQALREAEIEIVDSSDQRLPPNEIGQIRTRRPGMIDSYLNDQEATRKAFRSGWFYTGDLGRFTPAGQLIFCGRADHMMIMNGINIYPEEIERTVLRHPAVRDAAAIPLPSPVYQDIPVCAAVLHPGAQATERELLAFAHQHLGSRGPQKMVILESIPRNEQGKLLRHPLKELIDQRLRRSSATTGAAKLAYAPTASAARTKLQQSFRQIQILCEGVSPINLQAIDDWLGAALKIEIPPCNTSLGQPGNARSRQALELTWRILLLFRELMQAARIPVFDPGCIVGIAPDRTGAAAWTATVAVARIDHLPPACHSLAGDGAVRIVRWITGKPRTPANTAALFDMIQKQILQPLQRMFSSGKSTIHVLRAAHALDIPFVHLGAGIFQLGWGSRARRIDRSTTDRDAAIGSKLAQNKVWSANLIRLAGLPAPQHDVVSSDEEARRTAQRLGGPVVVKPIDRDRGEGVTVGISDDAQLLAALKTAKGLSKNRKVIVEREASGICHRLFIANGKLLYAVKRLPKSILGDGKRSIAELIQAANRNEAALPPWLRTERYPDDGLAVEAMNAAGFTLESVPVAGERVPLRQIESTAAGGFDEDVTDCIHPDNLDIAIRAAALFDLEIAGIDVITPDIGRPWHETGAIINEVNYAPLLGGGEISRSHIQEFLARIINGNGRIPVEAFIGNAAALAAARQRQSELVAHGTACHLTSHVTTLKPTGEEIPLPFDSLFKRCQALLMDKHVAAIVLVIQTDELLRTGLPVDRIERVATVGSTLLQPEQSDRLLQLRALLERFAGKPVPD